MILISLLLSWVTAISTTPLLCSLLLKPGAGDQDSDPYAAGPFRMYRTAVAWALRNRAITLGAVILMFALSVVGMGKVDQALFPSSNTPIFFVDIWEPEGTDIRVTRDDTLRVVEFLQQQEGVIQTSAAVGGPHQRFTLVYDAKEASPVYGQIIVQTATREHIPVIWAATRQFLREELPHTDPIIKQLNIGPGRDSKIEARFHGPDAEVLRDLAARFDASTALKALPADPLDSLLLSLAEFERREGMLWLRAIESRRDLVRATGSGTSAAIAATMRIQVPESAGTSASAGFARTRPPA